MRNAKLGMMAYEQSLFTLRHRKRAGRGVDRRGRRSKYVFLCRSVVVRGKASIVGFCLERDALHFRLYMLLVREALRRAEEECRHLV